MRRIATGLAAAMAATLIASGLSADLATADERKRPYIPKVPREKPVPYETEARGVEAKIRVLGKRDPIAGDQTSAPAAEQAAAEVAPGRTRLRAIGDLPIAVSLPTKGGTEENQVTARVFAQRVSKQAGVPGVLFGVVADPAAATPDATSATVQVDYSSFANMYGGGWSERLRLVAYPQCITTTPNRSECREGQPLATVNDADAGTLQAAVALEPVPGSSTGNSAQAGTLGTVVAATAAPNGSEGDFSATSLSPSGSWAHGGATGGFTWSYPLVTPTPGTGTAPSLSLAYDSSTVDGQNTTSNNQSSSIGTGWSLDPGFIERTYRPCSDLTSLPESKKTSDLCWAGQVVTISLPGGASGSLVRDDDTGDWHSKSDAGMRIELKEGADNGLWKGEHWVVTARNGTRYFFGTDRLPGSSENQATNSALGVPVFGPEPGDPCYDAAGFGQSRCANNSGYRWNLDYVVDRHGNASTYHYKRERNHYESTAGAGARLAYDRGAYLDRVSYGLNTADPGLFGDPAPQRIDFDAAERCFPGSGGGGCDDADFKVENASKWPDVPIDLACGGSGTCDTHAPTFWSRKRLTKVTTTVHTAGAYRKVDEYELGQSFSPHTGNELVLDSITRTGWKGASSLTLPPVRFGMQALANRVEGLNSLPGMHRVRMTTIATETGQTIVIAYNGPNSPVDQAPRSCTASTIPASAPGNETLCYPVKWDAFDPDTPLKDYFHKYVVTSVTVGDQAATAPARTTKYYYQNPAWHYDDNEVLRPKYRTWSQFRGFRKVETRTGGNNYNWTSSKVTFFQGMDADRTASGGEREVTISDSTGGEHADHDALAGHVLETQTFNWAGGPLVSKAITVPNAPRLTGSRARSGPLGPLRSYVTRTKSATSLTTKSGGFLEAKLLYQYDSDGRVVQILDSADGAVTRCTTRSYASNSSTWVKDAVSEERSYSGGCPGGSASATLMARSRTFFDGSSTLGSIVDGLATRTESFVDAQRAVASEYEHDAFGRQTKTVVETPDAVQTERVTEVAFVPTGVGPVTEVTTTLPLSTHKVVEDREPARGAVVRQRDVGGLVTEAEYDALGRVSSVWQPGQQRGVHQATQQYSYLVDPTRPLAVTSKELIDPGNGATPGYATKVELFDGSGTLRQTQVDAPGGGRTVSDQWVDAHGWVVQEAESWYTSGAPAQQLLLGPTGSLGVINETDYDGVGRPTLQASSDDDFGRWVDTETFYLGDRVSVFPPSGDTATTSVVNARGEVTELRQYTARPSLATGVPVGGQYVAQGYTYDALGRQVQMQTAKGVSGQEATWTKKYDMLGRVVETTEPSAGTSTTSYYDSGEIKSTVDSMGRKVSYDYDVLGRPLTRYIGDVNGEVKSTWEYDSLMVGALSHSVNTEDGKDYTRSVVGYDPVTGRPTGSQVKLDGLAGFNDVYTTPSTWTSTGLLASTAMPASKNVANTNNGRAAEALAYHYDRLGNPKAMTGINAYVTDVTYDSMGAPTRTVYGVNNQTLVTTRTYAEFHRLRTETTTGQVLASPQLDRRSSYYDDSGNVTLSAHQLGNASSTQWFSQCFRYDQLRQLTEAWSAPAGSCVISGSTPSVGGAHPYWLKWSYREDGSRTKQLKPAFGGRAVSETSYLHAEAGKPHQLSVADTEGTPNDIRFTYNLDGAVATRTVGSAVTRFTYDTDGSLKSVAAPGGSSTYVQDADGAILMRTDPDGSTLYLGDQEIKVANDAARTVSTNRYYMFAGETAWVRADWAAARKVIGDANGTTQVSVDPNNGWAVSRRYMDPYGNALTPAAGTLGVMPGTRDFVNQPRNKVTSFVDMGARQYDSVTGQFLSVDPIVQGTDVKQSQGYTYANNNPVTFSDPSGLSTDYGESGVCPRSGCPDYSAGGDPIGLSGLVQGGVDIVRDAAQGAKEGLTKPRTYRDSLGALLDLAGPSGDLFTGCAFNLKVQLCPSDLTDYLSDHVLKPDRDSATYQTTWWAALIAAAGWKSPSAARSGAPLLSRLLGRTKPVPPASVAAKLAPRQIDASWGGLIKYKHGGPMTAIEHINYRHAYASGFSNVSKYSKGTSVRNLQEYVDDALRHGSVSADGTMVRHDIGRVIGTDQLGNPVTGIQMYVRNGQIQTAFPVAWP